MTQGQMIEDFFNLKTENDEKVDINDILFGAKVKKTNREMLENRLKYLGERAGIQNNFNIDNIDADLYVDVLNQKGLCSLSYNFESEDLIKLGWQFILAFKGKPLKGRKYTYYYWENEDEENEKFIQEELDWSDNELYKKCAEALLFDCELFGVCGCIDNNNFSIDSIFFKIVEPFNQHLRGKKLSRVLCC